MKSAFVVVAMVLAGEMCSKKFAPEPAASTPVPSVAATAPVAAAATTAPAAAAAKQAPDPPSGASGPCWQLAHKCAKCPAGAVQTACRAALTAGTADARACANALADKDITAQCK